MHQSDVNAVVRFPTPYRRPTVTIALLVLLGIAACSPKDSGTTDTSSAGVAKPVPSAMTPVTAASDSTNHAGMSGMAMTGDPDRDFLRMMSDHHKGLIAMAHETIERKETLAVKPIARRLDKEQDDELDKMVTMLEKDFKDPYAPNVLPEHQAMVDQLKPKTATEYDQTFLANVVKHHEAAIKMVDDYLPQAKNSTVKAMAEKMKAAQQKEIAEFQSKRPK
jgi:uncharacterized protein (DUF305 family)